MATPDPRDWPLAWTAASWICGGVKPKPALVKAIIAHWACESGWKFPHQRNNPGSNALGAAAATGFPFLIYGTGTPPAGYTWSGPDPYTSSGQNPQPSLPIVTYPDSLTGALAYAKGFTVIRNADGTLKYQQAIDAARAGDGRGFIAAALAQGYGTSMSCFDSVYPYVTTPPEDKVQLPYTPSGRIGTAVSNPDATHWAFDADRNYVKLAPGVAYPVFGRGTLLVPVNNDNTTRLDVLVTEINDVSLFVLADNVTYTPDVIATVKVKSDGTLG